MNEFKVIIDMTYVLPKFKTFKLGEFHAAKVELKLTASDPDDACYNAFQSFCDIILEQDSSSKMKCKLKDTANDFIVRQLVLLK